LLKFLLPPFSYCLDKLDGIIGVASLTLDYFPHFKGKKALIPNGINLKEFNPDNPVIEKYKDGKINILFVGRIEERKGLIYLLRAFKLIKEKHKNTRLIVVGDGPLKKECQDFVLENKLEDVVFEGQKLGKETASYFNTCDIYVSPAPFGESFGIVLLEAMASQKPAVGFANKGYYELLKGTEGEKFLVEPGDIEALARKIEELIVDEGLRKKMGEWGLRHAKKYSWEKVADRILDFYKSLS
ncbi:MAG: glycosyltransferase family 4 protein, partial [Candidatus Pacebacteria bacterium]|nr:glycosyltransferase family 4 protein [Candidatus Paceibacterota bacterium]